MLVGNIYASAIDFANLVKSNVTSFKVWDPKLAGTSGLGAFQTFSSSVGYAPVPGGGSYGSSPNSRIESGQAFIVSSTTGGSVTFTEAAKADGSNNYVFRQAAISQLHTNLYAVDKTGGNLLTDGAAVVFGNQYTSEVDNDDAIKVNNVQENLSIATGNSSLAIEARQPLAAADVIQLQLSGLQAMNYRLGITGSNIAAPGLTAYVADKYLHTQQPISLSDSAYVSFSVTADAASAAEDRFSIVFKNSNPATTTIRATDKGGKVQVQWTVSNEPSTAKTYEVEQSTNGSEFKTMGSTAASANGAVTASYSMTDEKPATGDNYYRIKAISKTGGYSYSSTAKVSILKGNGFVVYPNPVTDRTVKIQFINQAEGRYTIALVNKAGQVLSNTSIIHGGGSNTQSLSLPAGITQGNYSLEIMAADGKKTVQTVLVANK